ncbi:MAG TPA: hypothetical protein DCO79_08775, partial [Spirochaeta sp.]|nr:hypothetical protein [Spirochaeta sp.]
MMNKIKLTFLLLASAVIILFSSCGGMTADTDDVSIDLSAAVSRATVDGATINHVKIWLVYEGTSNFYPLPEDQAEQTLGDDNTITITHIPVGPSYRIYLSLGEKVEEKFTISKSVNGLINVTGGTSTGKTLQAGDIKTELFDTLVSEPVRGAAFANGKVFTVASNGLKIYHGTISSMSENNAPAGFVLTDVDAGYGDNVMITANADDGRAVGIFNGSSALADSDFDFSSGLATEMGGGAVNLQSSFVYYDNTAKMQLGISQMYGGVVLSVYADFDGDLSFETDWLPIDFSDALEALEEFDINLDDDFFKG